MAEYNPNSKYTWNPEDTFTLTGQEFGLFLNTVRNFLATEEAAKFQLMIQANQVIEKVLKASVEADIVKEVVESTPIQDVK